MIDKVSQLAVDGFVDGNCSQTNYEENPWWRVDLKKSYSIMAVVIVNCCHKSFKNVEVRIGDDENEQSNKICGLISVLKDKENNVLMCRSNIIGRYVHLSVRGRNKSLSLCEVQIYQALGTLFTLNRA